MTHLAYLGKSWTNPSTSTSTIQSPLVWKLRHFEPFQVFSFVLTVVSAAAKTTMVTWLPTSVWLVSKGKNNYKNPSLIHTVS